MGAREWVSKEPAFEALDPGLDKWSDDDADQHAGNIGEKIEEIRIAIDEWHQLAEFTQEREPRSRRRSVPAASVATEQCEARE